MKRRWNRSFRTAQKTLLLSGYLSGCVVMNQAPQQEQTVAEGAEQPQAQGEHHHHQTAEAEKKPEHHAEAHAPAHTEGQKHEGKPVEHPAHAGAPASGSHSEAHAAGTPASGSHSEAHAGSTPSQPAPAAGGSAAAGSAHASGGTAASTPSTTHNPAPGNTPSAPASSGSSSASHASGSPATPSSPSGTPATPGAPGATGSPSGTPSGNVPSGAIASGAGVPGPTSAPIVVPQPPASTPPSLKPTPAAPTGSNIVVPVESPFADLVKRLDSLIPATAHEDWTTVNKDTPQVDIKYDVWRDPIKASYNNGVFSITVPLHYAANFRTKVKNPLGGWVDVNKDDTWGTRAQPQQLTATIHVKVGIGNDWKISADSTVDPLQHGAAPSGKVCTDSALKVCVEKSEIAPMINKRLDAYLIPKIQDGLKGAAGQIDQALNLKKRAGDVWAAMQQPQSLQQIAQQNCPTEIGAVCKQPAWLVLSPSGVGLSQPKMDHDNLSVEVSLLGKLNVVTGNKPNVKPTALPGLSNVTDPAGFHIATRLSISTASLSQALDKELKGVNLGQGGQQLTVKGASVVGRADGKQPHRLVVQLMLSGALDATIYLYADLGFDAASQSLYVSNFDYTAETENQFAKKLASVDHAAFKKALAGKARLNLGSEAGALKGAIGAALNATMRDQLSVSGDLPKVEVSNFTATPEALALDLVLDGAFKVKYTPK